MKKKILILVIAVTAVLAVSLTLAFMLRETEPIQNDFVPAEVSCSVEEKFDSSQKTSIKVRNDSNIACYLRVRLISYWQNGSGKIVGKASVMPDVVFDETNWLEDAENNTYYYQTPVKPDEQTEQNLLKTPIVLAEDTFNGEPVYQVVQVFAEAIQAQPKDAVRNAWPFMASHIN